MIRIDHGLPGGAVWTPLELGYRVAVRVRSVAYGAGWARSHRLPAQVVSVGNIVVGGAGKTPLIIDLARQLHAAGRRVAVLCRGYRGSGERGINEIAPGSGAAADPRRCGDEAVLIARRVPEVAVLSGADRVVLGQRAIDRFGADILVLDDGFQHRRLQRDLDIVVLRAPRPFGNGRCLPRGPLREPLAALARADVVVINSSDGPLTAPLPEWLQQGARVVEVQQRPQALVQLAGGALRPLAALRDLRVILALGIAHPEAVEHSVEALGARVVDVVARPDHHTWSAPEIAALQHQAQLARAVLLTSEKDAVKWERPPASALALRITTVVLAGAPDLAALVTAGAAIASRPQV